MLTTSIRFSNNDDNDGDDDNNNNNNNNAFPSVSSCHHGMARPLGCGWGSRPPDMEVSCEYIE